MLTTLLELLALLLLVAFAFCVWPPLALLATSCALLVASWSLSGRKAPRKRQNRREGAS